MPSGRVAMSLPCRDLRREDAVGALCREARTDGGPRTALCEEGRRAYLLDASISAVSGVAPRSETRTLPYWPQAEEREPLMIQAAHAAPQPS